MNLFSFFTAPVRKIQNGGLNQNHLSSESFQAVTDSYTESLFCYFGLKMKWAPMLILCLCYVFLYMFIFIYIQCELILQLASTQTSEKSNLDPKCFFLFGANSFLVVVLVWIPGRAWELLGRRLNSNKALNYQNILPLPAALIIWIFLIYLLVI